MDTGGVGCRATLLDGRFVPRGPMSNYPLVSARYRFAIQDALRRELKTGFPDLTRSAHGFDVPPSGLLSLQRGM